MAGLYIGDGVCFLRGTSCIFKYDVSSINQRQQPSFLTIPVHNAIQLVRRH